MSEDEFAISPGPADVTWPRRALARLALSHAAAELAEQSTGMVLTINDVWGRPNEYVAQAAQLVAAAREVLDRAVVYARERGASWADIGESLHVSRQAAHERYAPVLAKWDSGLDEPRTRHGRFLSPRLPGGASEPDPSAARVDR